MGKPLNLLNSNRISVGQKVKIKDGFRIECYENFNNKILNPSFIIEDGVIIGPYFTAFVASDLRIGKDTIFAGNVTLITENHGMNPESPIPYHAQPLITGIISIGEGCWLGQNVSVLPNVRIGNKCIIATGSVVNSDIPDYSIAAGIPAKVIKKYNFQNHTWERVLNES
ncbi:MAG: acyltransferase [Paramuribaculum sp.]|nr:acyltransferase [Paramuribaculum sp.]